MVRKLTFSSVGVLALAVVVVATLLSLACGSSMDPARSVAAAGMTGPGSSGGSNSGGSGSGGSGSGGSSKVQLEGPIEELTPAMGVPIALRIYGVTANIQAAQIVLKREGEGEDQDKNEAQGEAEDKISLDPRDLATTQFVEVEFITATMAEEVEVRAGEAEGTLQNLVTFSPAPTVTVNRNSRMINATFTVAGAGILCDNSFTRVQVDSQIGSCAQLAQLNGVNVKVRGLVVHNFALSLADLNSMVSPRDVILAARVQQD